MKTFNKGIGLFIVVMLLTFMTLSCEKAGVTTKKLGGNELNLPAELKGLQVYLVSLGEGEYVKVAVVNNKVNSLTYTEGKTQHTTIILNQGSYSNERTIVAKEILAETDEILIIKK